jgi:hypothetical protein
MNRKTALVTLGVAATVVVATVAAATGVPAVAASSAKTVTQHFDAKSSSSVLMLSKTSYVLTDKDVESGKKIGRDVLYCTDTGTGTSHCHVAFAQKGGLLYAKFALPDTTGVLTGKVTGGTGRFAHAKGTLAGQAVSQTDVKITLHYKK